MLRHDQDDVQETLEFDLPGAGELSLARLGAWDAVGFGTLVLVVFVVVQILCLYLLGAITYVGSRGTEIGTLIADIGQTGFYFSLAICASALVCAALVAVIIKARSASLATEVALRRIGPRAYLAATLAVVVFEMSVLWAGEALHRPAVPDYFIVAYLTAYSLPLLWISVGVVGPLFEEMFFRGFVFGGLERSRIGAWGAVVVTAGVWAAIHVQYDLYDMSLIFVLGLVLGVIRVKTQSIYACLYMHVLVNLIALMGCVLYLAEQGAMP